MWLWSITPRYSTVSVLLKYCTVTGTIPDSTVLPVFKYCTVPWRYGPYHLWKNIKSGYWVITLRYSTVSVLLKYCTVTGTIPDSTVLLVFKYCTVSWRYGAIGELIFIYFLFFNTSKGTNSRLGIPERGSILVNKNMNYFLRIFIYSYCTVP